MQFPLDFRFTKFTLTRQILVTDANGADVCHVKQKAFRLKEDIVLHRDRAQTIPLGNITADRIIDWSARYTFRDPAGHPLGAVGRQGAKSLWRTHYDIFSDPASSVPSMTIQEESVVTRMLDGLLGGIPVLGIFTGYFFHPSYAVARPDGTVVARLRKKAALFEGRFTLEKAGAIEPEEEIKIMLACLMMSLLEQHRG